MHKGELLGVCRSPRVFGTVRWQRLRWDGRVDRMKGSCIQTFGGDTLIQSLWEVDETDSGSYPMVGFGIFCVEPCTLLQMTRITKNVDESCCSLFSAAFQHFPRRSEESLVKVNLNILHGTRGECWKCPPPPSPNKP
jgi:hypothetical protein